VPEDMPFLSLRVYDLDEKWLNVNEIFSEVLPVGGIFHTALEVYGLEWSYGRDGVEAYQPEGNPHFPYRESIKLGFTPYSVDKVHSIITEEMSPQWIGSEYDVLRHNCCDFVRVLSHRLGGDDVPSWVDRFAGLGKLVSGPAEFFGKDLSEILEGDVYDDEGH